MERIKRSERFKDTYENAGEEHAKFGDTELSFGGFREVEFNENPEPGESKEDYRQRLMNRDENVFIAGLIAAEKDGEEGMKNALGAENFRIKRSQRQEFLSAVADLSDEEYSAKINGVLGAFGSENSRKMAFSFADSIRDKALEQREIDIENMAGRRGKVKAGDFATKPEPRIERKSHKSYEITVNDSVNVERAEAEASRGWEEGGFYPPYKPEVPTPQVEKIMRGEAKYYRKAKQERRAQRFLAKAKGLFEKGREKIRASKKERDESSFGLEEEFSERFNEDGSFGIERPESGYFRESAELDGAPRPEGGWFKKPEEEKSRYSSLGEYDEPSYGEPDDFSGDWWDSRRSA